MIEHLHTCHVRRLFPLVVRRPFIEAASANWRWDFRDAYVSDIHR